VRKQIAPDRYRSSGNLLRDLITGSEGKHSIDQTTAAKFIAEDMMLIAPSLTGMEYTRK
jgi:hypothetical protein